MDYKISRKSNPKWNRFSSGEEQVGDSSGVKSQNRFSSGEEQVGDSSGVKSQDTNYSYLPGLIDELALLILARVPRSEYWKFCCVNKRYLSLVKSGELFRIRRDIGINELSVFLLTSEESNWCTFDRQFKSLRKLPILPSGECFTCSDKESFCVGTHMIVSGREVGGAVIWRYELATNRWFKAPSMIKPRGLFASVTSGTVAFVAGGIELQIGTGALDSAEIYDSKTKSWMFLPLMHRRRKLCSACYMDGKFFVLGGTNERGEYLTCGEAYDINKNTWMLIPDMWNVPQTLKLGPPPLLPPPLLAVVNNELYSLETLSNELKVYLKSSNSWRKLGPVPIRVDLYRGWGLAFKSLGNELLVLGPPSSISFGGRGVTGYTCCPSPDAEELQWRPLEISRSWSSHFILNCCIMEA